MHCAWLLALLPDGTALTASRLAEFYDLPESYLAKLLKALVLAGLLGSSTGPRGGFRLARPPDVITVLDIADAVDPAASPAAACRRPCGIAAVMHEAERAWRSSLGATTVADLAGNASIGSLSRAKEWFGRLSAQVQAR